MKIGHVEVEQGILLAPMEDVTDLPFRRICKRYGADIVYTEFISSDGLVRDAKRSMEKLRLAEEERPRVGRDLGSLSETINGDGDEIASVLIADLEEGESW